MNKQEYKEYLKSDHWLQLRDQKRKKKCAICGFPAADTHHLLYHDIYDCGTSDLRKLCRACHKTAHLLLKSGVIKPNKPDSHQSVFSATKNAVKRHRFGDPCISNAEIRRRLAKA